MTRVEAVIVAGGFGTRMLPLTRHRPKHLLPLAGIPLVAHQLAKLAHAGVTRVVLATSYHAEQFESTLGDGRRWGVELVYVREQEPLGTGGAIRNAANELKSRPEDAVVVLNGDIISSHDLVAQLAAHQAAGADVTLHLVDVPDARSFGCVPTDEHGRVLAFLEKDPSPVSTQINAGCYVFDRAVIDAIPAGKVVSVERETFPSLLAGGHVVLGRLDQRYWIDVGTPEALRRASCDVVRGVASSLAFGQPAAESWRSERADVAADAILVGGTAVGADATVGPGARIVASVLDEGAVVAAGARVDDCVLARGAVVGPGETVVGQVLDSST